MLTITQETFMNIDLEKYSTPSFRKLRQKKRLKRTAKEAFVRSTNSFDGQNHAPKKKQPVRRPPPVLTLYVRKENEKAFHAMNLDEPTLEALKVAVSQKYSVPCSLVDLNLKIQNNERSQTIIDEEMVKNFNNEDVFLISLDYNKSENVCQVIFQSPS